MIGLDTHDQADAAVVDELVSVFADRMSRRVIAAEVERATLELSGQVPAGALPELLHRLVAHRLARLTASGQPR